MAIDHRSETIIPIKKAPAHFPSRVHISAVYRWLQHPDHPLESIMIGGRRHTSIEAIDRFIARCSGAEPTPTAAMSARRLREIEAAEARLDAAGVR